MNKIALRFLLLISCPLLWASILAIAPITDNDALTTLQQFSFFNGLKGGKLLNVLASQTNSRAEMSFLQSESIKNGISMGQNISDIALKFQDHPQLVRLMQSILSDPKVVDKQSLNTFTKTLNQAQKLAESKMFEGQKNAVEKIMDKWIQNKITDARNRYTRELKDSVVESARASDEGIFSSSNILEKIINWFKGIGYEKPKVEEVIKIMDKINKSPADEQMIYRKMQDMITKGERLPKGSRAQEEFINNTLELKERTVLRPQLGKTAASRMPKEGIQENLMQARSKEEYRPVVEEI